MKISDQDFSNAFRRNIMERYAEAMNSLDADAMSNIMVELTTATAILCFVSSGSLEALANARQLTHSSIDETIDNLVERRKGRMLSSAELAGETLQ